jgi:GTPase
VIEYSDKEQVTVADIPGLIEGAAENRGLGHEFLRHVERTKVLLYVVDISGTSNKGDSHQGHGGGIGGSSTERKVDAVADFLTLRRELELYNPELLNKPSVVLANKLDITRTLMPIDVLCVYV